MPKTASAFLECDVVDDASVDNAPPKKLRRTCKGPASTLSSASGEFLSVLVKQHQCPITHQLLIDPVVAKDGHVYERSALTKWLACKQTSPVTGEAMEVDVVPAVLVRQTVSHLVANGALKGSELARFLAARATQRVLASSNAGWSELAVAQEDFNQARQLNLPEEETKTLDFQLEVLEWIRQGVKFSSIAADDHSEEVREWLAQVGSVMGDALSIHLSRRMTTFTDLRVGTQVKVISDVAELKRLCERPATPATEAVGWNPEMAVFAGKTCTVRRTGDQAHQNYVLRRVDAPSARCFSFPFSSLTLVR
jgi:hypothetical protein